MSKLAYVNSAKSLRVTSNRTSLWRLRATAKSLVSTFPRRGVAGRRNWQACSAAAKDLDEMIASWGATEKELMDQYKQIRRSAREKKLNAK